MQQEQHNVKVIVMVCIIVRLIIDNRRQYWMIVRQPFYQTGLALGCTTDIVAGNRSSTVILIEQGGISRATGHSSRENIGIILV